MKLHRQTHLGHRASSKSLTIIDSKPPPSHASNAASSKQDSSTNPNNGTSSNILATKTFIFQIPDELLLAIVEIACAASKPEYPTYMRASTYDKAVVRTLSRVCKRLKRLAQPLLFQEITIEYPNSLIPPSIPVIKLHRTLKERADLRECCRSLHMQIRDRQRVEYSYSVALDFAEWLTRTRCLFVHGGFESTGTSDQNGKMGNTRTWDLQRRMAANFSNLEHVDISREGWGLYLPPIFKWLACPNLKTLNIHGISEWKHGDIQLEPEKLRTASFTTLSLSDYEERPEATRLLLHWPTKLMRFKFGSFYNNRHVMDYPMFESWLFVHRDTLTHIDIGYLSRRGSKRLFNATLFPNLEFLGLSRWQMHTPVEFSSQNADVLGARLKTFAWNFSIYDQHSEGWCDFGEAEVDWVRGLVEAAVERKACLKTIKVTFTPDSYWGTTEAMGYPWDRMDALRETVLKPKGIDLVYNEPSISKDAWLQFLKTGKLESEYDGDLAVGGARSERGSEADEEEEEEEEDLLGKVIQRAYQGEDIRGYFVKEPKIS